MSLPLVAPEGTTISSTQSSVSSLIPDTSDAPKPRLPKARVFIRRLPPRSSFVTSTSERYAFDDDFPSIAASDSTHACFLPPTTPDTVQEPDRATFRGKIRRISKRRDSAEHSFTDHYCRHKTPHVGCAQFFTSWFAKRQKDLDPPPWEHQHQPNDFNMFSIMGYDDFMHGAPRRPSAAARMMARIRGD